MGKQIKGITIEIGAETKGFKNGLKDLNKSSKDLQNELSAVNRALKHDPKNTELLRQKQELLTKSVAETKTKLDVLRQAKETADKQMASGTEINQEEYRKLQREISFTETKLDGLKRETKNFGSVGKQSIKAVGDELKEVGSKMQDIGGKMTATVTAPIVAGAGAAVVGTREYREEMNKLEAAFTTAGHTAEDAKEVYDGFYAVLGETDRSVEAVNHLAKMRLTQEGLSEWTTIATGVWATFGDSLPIEGLTEAANETAKVAKVTGPLADALNWAGVSEDEFNQKLAAVSTEQERQAIITETLNGLYSDAAGKYRELNGDVIASNEAQTQLNDALANLGATLEPLVTKLTEFAAGLIEKFNALSPETQKIIMVFTGVAAVLGPLILIIGTLISSVQTIITLGPILSTALAGVKVAFAAIGGPVTIIMGIITALILKFIHAYQTSEEFRDKVNAAFEKVKEIVSGALTAVKEKVKEFIDVGKNVIEGIWNGITDKVDWLKGKVTGVVDTIKGWFTSKDGFDTHSPSKWSEGIGAWVMEGLGNGFEKFKPALDAAKNAVIRIKNDFNKNIKDALNSTNAQIEALQKQAIKERADLELKQYKDNLAKKKEQLLKAESKDKKAILDEIAQIEAEWNKKQIDAARTAEEQKLQERMSVLKEMEGDYETALSAIEQKQSSIQDKLSGYGSLFSTEQDDDGNVKYKTNSLKEYIATMDEYQSVIEELKRKGADEGLLAEMNNMSVDDAIGYGQQLLEMDKGAFEEYNALWVEKQQKAKEIAESLYKSELDLLSTDFNGKLDSELSILKQTTFATGSDSILSLIDGMNSQENAAISAAKALGSRIASALKSAKDDGEEDADGSHRTGLFRVPFDGYKAILHKNERVLTAAEAARYSGGNTTTNNDSFTVNIAKVENSNGRTTQDLMREMEFYRKSKVAAVGGA